MMNWFYLKLIDTGKIKVVFEDLSFIFYCLLRVIIVTSRHSTKVKVLVNVIFPSSGGQLAKPSEQIYIHQWLSRKLGLQSRKFKHWAQICQQIFADAEKILLKL